MTKTTVVNYYHQPTQGDEFVYIGRPSKWGNPFTFTPQPGLKVLADRDRAVEAYREWIQTQSELMEALEELRGKTLVCFCKPKSCHGDVLVELVEAL